LKVEKVKEIKILQTKENPYKTKKEWDETIGKKYGVSKDCITGIRLGYKWKGVII